METGSEPVRIDLQYSGAVRALVIAAGLATCVIVVRLPWSAPLRGFLALGVACLALRARHRLFEVQSFVLQGDGRIRIRGRDGASTDGRLASGSFVAAWLTLVRWRPPGAWIDRTVLIVPGMAHPDALRRLRVRLRHG